MTTLLNLVLAIPSSATATNFYADSSDASGHFQTTANDRRDQLDAHLRAVQAGDVVVVGEAAGWQGARQSGVAFTSPRMLGLAGTSEPSATVVHRALAKHRLQGRTLLWNAFPVHPHEAGQHETNRPPTSAELRSGYASLRAAMVGRRVICVGAKAAKSVGTVLGAPVATVATMTPTARAVTVRHPSFGGVTAFSHGIDDVVRQWSL